ncbi:MAG: hypothetical protein K9H64_08070 [Bacteroidales bacterium]|nr:hypothetical protein [Bacteroidales bacterium]MCF8455700.1 hypothetical protein [Bacteroidales bacterium]
MQNITTATELKNAIQTLESDYAIQEKLLKAQFHLTYESIKPINLIKSTIKDITSSPYLIDNMIGTAIGLSTGYVTKLIVVGSKGNVFKKLLGSVLQFGVTNLVAQNADTIKSYGQLIFQNIFNKKDMNPGKSD